MAKPRILDLFCCAGGAGMGYHLAGWEVVGVDNRPQPDYPFEFHQADALTFPLDGFDAIHASPPCQAYSPLRARNPGREYPDLVASTRERLRSAGVPSVIENVPGAPLIDPVLLCGSMFGLRTGEFELRRHRLFELSGFSVPRLPCNHQLPALGVYGHGGGKPSDPSRGLTANAAQARELMGITWTSRSKISQAIPPAYAEYIGRHIPHVVTSRRAA